MQSFTAHRTGVGLLCLLVISLSAHADLGDIIHTIPTAGTASSDLAWVDGQLYQAITSPEGQEGIYRLNPETGQILGIINHQGDVPHGLAYDGEYLWQSDPDNSAIYKLNPITGSYQGTFDGTGLYDVPLGLAWDGENLWVANGDETAELFKLNQNGNIMEPILDSPIAEPYGLTYGGGFLWVAGENHNTIPTLYQVDPVLGEVIEFHTLGAPYEAPLGLAFDSEFLWLSDSFTGLIRQMDDGILSGPTTPDPFSLIAPEQDGLVRYNLMDFIWHSSFDPDTEFGDTVRYSIFIENLDNPFNIDSVTSIEDTVYSWDLAEGSWSWLVRANDVPGHFVFSNETWSFTKDHNIVTPDTFDLAEPVNNTQLMPEEVETVIYSWQPSFDEDPESSIIYRLYAETFDSLAVSDPLEDTTLTVDPFIFLDFPDLPWDTSGIDSRWWVVAYSQGDSTCCRDTFHLIFGEVNVMAEDQLAGLPYHPVLEAIYPNPFNAALNVRFSLPSTGLVHLRMFDLLGREVLCPVEDHFPAGRNVLSIEAGNLASGIYFLVFETGDLRWTMKVVLLK